MIIGALILGIAMFALMIVIILGTIFLVLALGFYLLGWPILIVKKIVKSQFVLDKAKI